MKKQFYIYYESAHWCGHGNYVIVWANSAEEAEEEADEFMDEAMRDLYASEYAEDEEEGGCMSDDAAHSVKECVEFGPEHEAWQFYMDPVQREHFYPTIGSPD